MRQTTVIVPASARRDCIAMTFCAVVLLGCADPVRPLSGELTYLGLEGQSITALTQTPWGLFAGTRSSGIYRYQPDSGSQWKSGSSGF